MLDAHAEELAVLSQCICQIASRWPAEMPGRLRRRRPGFSNDLAFAEVAISIEAEPPVEGVLGSEGGVDPCESSATVRGVEECRHLRGVGPRAQARAVTSRVKAAMMTATRT